MDLTGKRILVTGATGALGRAVCQAAAVAGAVVFPTWILEQDEAMAAELSANGGTPIRADVTQLHDAEAAVATVVAGTGGIDGLCSTVGGYDGGNPVAELDIERWDRMLAMNLTSAVVMCRAVLPHMLRADRGRIVNVASRAALRPAAGQAAYNVAKAGVITLTETIAEEVKLTGVTCNAIMPSTIDTAANRRDMPKANFDNWPKPEQIAPVVLFLLSDASAVVNGAVIPVFGRDR
jgi:NAD(P)-dependent dehydrogenase (short-subunit alcohol dehydrogenase family)